MLRLSRAFSTAPRLSAAAAAATATPAKATINRRVAARAAPAATKAAASRLAARKTSAASSAAASSPAPAPSPTPTPAPDFDSYDDFAASSFEEIEDYAHLKAPSTPNPSPPLQSLPGAGYIPLPPAPATTSTSPSTSPSMPTATAVRARTQSDEIGTASMGDGYVFKMPGEQAVEDWTTSFKGLSERPFEREVADALLKPLDASDVEIKPDGLLYLPEIKYRRTLNAAFGPGGWGMAPRGETHIGPRIVSREWGLVCLGRLVAIARGEQEYFDPSGIPTATEACKSNALMRCCKDLGIASELWDPRFIREFKREHCVEAMVEHVTQKKKRKLWRMKNAKFEYPYKEIGPVPK